MDDLAKSWFDRIQRSKKKYDEWSNKFECDKMEEYFYGFQWDGSPDNRYVMNFVFSTIEVKKPSLLFTEPLFHVKPKPVGSEWDFEASIKRALIREDVINTIISDEDQDFDSEFEIFVVDAFFRFGILEIGYSVDWIENPNAGMPVLKSDNDPYADPDSPNNVLKEPEKIPEQERVYFKRIPPWRFRVGGDEGQNFKKVSWVGYKEKVRLHDLRANKSLQNKEELFERTTGMGTGAAGDGTVGTSLLGDDEHISGDDVWIWHIWDLRAKKKFIFCETPQLTLLEKSYKFLPLVPLKFVEKLRGWYPAPPVFQWKSPQDEINEARQQQRIHRRRAARKYLYRDGAFPDDNEIDKLENGEDMAFAKVMIDPTSAVRALEQPPNDPSVAQSMLVGRDDLNIISGTSSEQRGQADRVTATQATLLDQRTQLRESRGRMQVARALRSIGRLILLTVREHFSEKFWVKCRTSQYNEDFLGEFQQASEEWKQFTASDLGEDDDFTIDISLDTISPLENAQSKQNYVEFLSLLTNFPAISFDPVLVRETAYRCNYRNEKVIQRAAMLAQLAAIGRVEAAKQSVQQQAVMSGMQDQALESAGGSNLAQTRVEQMKPPDQNTINTQLNGQLGVQ